jgi:menaquinone-dependent protoporphyrinogen oxidase
MLKYNLLGGCVSVLSKALIVFGTRYGAAANTSEEIAKTLQQEGIETEVVNAKEQKIKDITTYDLIVVGSGIQIDRWTGEPEDFLKKFQKQLAAKKLAIFVCCGSATDKEKPGAAERARQKYLEEKAAKYKLNPVMMGLFGGVYNFNKVPWYMKKGMEAFRPQVEASYKEIEPGVYDTRDLNVIHTWSQQLAKTVQ